jgi:hypothetical protein
MPHAISLARDDAPAAIPMRVRRGVLAVLVLAATYGGAVATATYVFLSQAIRTMFSSSAKQGIAPAFLERMLIDPGTAEDVCVAAFFALMAATVVLAAALVVKARWMEWALPAWCVMATCFVVILLLGTERPELREMAVAMAAWLAYIPAVAWAVRRTEPREASPAAA